MNKLKENQIEHYPILSKWCAKNGLFVRSNQEAFFINERVIMKPQFIINEAIYVDIINEKKITKKYVEYCKIFSQSFGTIIVIPLNFISEINSVTSQQIEGRYSIKFK
jgi:hypothetical protein